MDNDERPLLKRIIDYPLVTMVVALTVLIGFSGFAGGILELGYKASGSEPPKWLSGLLAAAVMLIVYKLIIRHLGERPRDDLSGPGSVRELSFGLLIGAVLFSAIVGIAALLGVYRITGLGVWAFYAMYDGIGVPLWSSHALAPGPGRANKIGATGRQSKTRARSGWA